MTVGVPKLLSMAYGALCPMLDNFLKSLPTGREGDFLGKRIMREKGRW